MSDQVTLTAYADEIRELVRHNRNDEALAICKHILRYFPKHIETVRQMAEALLEQRDLDGAQDLFRRVLSADPENAVAYVGLASIFEEKQLMDEAVWHMERAFELSPTHPEIHKELLRLQGANASKLRPRLKLTPGALARLYAYQGLLAQATQEFRALVAGDPTRLDARVALAEMLWRTNRIHEAAQVAQDLLAPLPYCLKANLILGTAWKESSLPESEAYLQRAQTLDPTNQVAHRLLGARSPLPLAEPSMPRYVEGAPPPAPVEEKIAPVEAAVESVFDVTLPRVIEPSAETVAEHEIELGPSPKPALPISALPPWLRSDAGEATTLSEMPPVKPSVAEEASALPPWMSQPHEPVAAPPAPVEEPAPTPAWMDRTEATVVEEIAPTVGAEEFAIESARLSETPETISEQPAPALAEEPAEKIAGLPAWLSSTQETVAEEPARVIAEEPPAEKSAGLPAWLTRAEETPAEQAPAKVTPEAQPDFFAAETETPVETWPAETIRASEPPLEEPAPEWIAQLRPADAAHPVSPAAEPAALEYPLAESSQPSAPPAESVAPKRARQPKGSARLKLAREHRDANRVEEALTEYDWIVQRAPRLINDVIVDLETLVRRAGVPIDAHRILGDAYARADRLADALERYRFLLDRVSES